MNASATAAADATGTLGIAVKVPVLERGAQQTAIGAGFKPGEVVTGVMTSDPLALGTQVVNDQGTVTFTWAIPAVTDLGTHTVTLTGALSGSVAGTFTVSARRWSHVPSVKDRRRVSETLTQVGVAPRGGSDLQ